MMIDDIFIKYICPSIVSDKNHMMLSYKLKKYSFDEWLSLKEN